MEDMSLRKKISLSLKCLVVLVLIISIKMNVEHKWLEDEFESYLYTQQRSSATKCLEYLQYLGLELKEGNREESLRYTTLLIDQLERYEAVIDGLGIIPYPMERSRAGGLQEVLLALKQYSRVLRHIEQYGTSDASDELETMLTFYISQIAYPIDTETGIPELDVELPMSYNYDRKLDVRLNYFYLFMRKEENAIQHGDLFLAWKLLEELSVPAPS